jgi:tetratricopeptide (TPR) repeat protein
MQGEYREAIDAYRKLLQQRPENSDKYEKRLEELERLLREQLPPVS